MVTVASLLLGAAAVHYTVHNLGVSTDPRGMLSKRLPSRAAFFEYEAQFPQFVDTLLVVVDAPTPDLARIAADSLAARLRAQTELVEWVEQPRGGDFFGRHGLLYLSSAQLQELGDQLARVQPFLTRLAAEPTLVGLFGVLGELSRRRPDGAVEVEPILDAVSRAAEASLEDRFHSTSWQGLIHGEPAPRSSGRSYLVVGPKLDYGELFPAKRVLARIRSLARELDPDLGQVVRVRITDGTAMEHEELETVARGAGYGVAAALLMVTLVLWVGLRSWRAVAASLITLVLGLLWTAAFAAVAVGHLNLISVAFAVLYIGLALDFSIHFCLRYRELLGHGASHETALGTCAGDVGGTLVLCAVSTGIGFYAFVPTDFTGVAELGLIAGTGMFIGLAATLTVLPALLSLAPLPAAASAPRNRDTFAPGIAIHRNRRFVVAAAAVLALAASTALPAIRFDGNPLNLRDSQSESVATFRELLRAADTSPWSTVILADDVEAVARLSSRLEALDTVDRVWSVFDLVPAEQERKLALVDDLDLLLGAELALDDDGERPDFTARRDALRRLLLDLRATRHEREGREARAVARLEEALARVDSAATAERLQRLETGLLGALPDQLARLSRALAPEPITLERLPPELRARWVGPDGRFRLEVLPAHDLDDPAELERFVADVTRAARDATGTPMVILESARSVVGALRQALLSAVILIAVVLVIALRRARDVSLVLLPLLAAGTATIAAMVWMGISFNFANVIALPLLLGVGVDSGIHMVHRMRSAPPRAGDILRSSTSRAIVVSALTTICGFGSLAFSAHPGTASLGTVLTLGLAFTLAFTLVLLPALLLPSAAPRDAAG